MGGGGAGLTSSDAPSFALWRARRRGWSGTASSGPPCSATAGPRAMGKGSPTGRSAGCRGASAAHSGPGCPQCRMQPLLRPSWHARTQRADWPGAPACAALTSARWAVRAAPTASPPLPRPRLACGQLGLALCLASRLGAWQHGCAQPLSKAMEGHALQRGQAGGLELAIQEVQSHGRCKPTTGRRGEEHGGWQSSPNKARCSRSEGPCGRAAGKATRVE